MLQKELAGTIYKSRNCYVFQITKAEDLETKLFPILDLFPLNSSKNLDYLIFREVFYLKKQKIYKTSEGLLKIKKLLSQLNNKRTDFTQPKAHTIRITPSWLIGFIEGDGSFYISKKKDHFGFGLAISQTAVEIKLLEAIQAYLQNLWKERFNELQITVPNIYIDDIKPRSFNHQLAKRVNVQDLAYIYLILIPFFNSKAFRSKKGLDYQDWTLGVQICFEGKHLTSEGFDLVSDLASRMNNSRLTTHQNYKVLEITDERIKSVLSSLPNMNLKKVIATAWIQETS